MSFKKRFLFLFVLIGFFQFSFGTEGVCGSSNENSFYSQPSPSTLCSYSRETPGVSGAGPWNWTCLGSTNIEPRDNCTAYKKEDGTCASTKNSCNAGTFNDWSR